jgi:hypothetical protein
MWTAIPLNLLSCLALAKAFHQLLKLAESEQTLMVHGKMMVAHLLAYALSILSLMGFLLSTMGYKTKKFSVTMNYLFIVLNLVT